MKATVNTMKIFGQILSVFLSALSGSAFAQSTIPSQAPNRFHKIVGEVSQLNDGNVVGNSWFYGKDGCYVVTNFHVAFGKSKKTIKHKVTGAEIERLVLVDNPGLGHKVKLNFDFNPKTQSFSRTAVATVAAFGIFEEDTILGIREDIALLRLDTCAGSEYAGLDIDRSVENQKNPQGNITMISSMRSPDGKTFIGRLNGCRATAETPGAGVVATNCATSPGMSGAMMLSEDKNGELRIVGLHAHAIEYADGSRLALGISAKYLGKFMDEYTGGEVLATTTVAEDRKPQSEEKTALLNTRHRTVVR